jgi:hypothetical protein
MRSEGDEEQGRKGARRMRCGGDEDMGDGGAWEPMSTLPRDEINPLPATLRGCDAARISVPVFRKAASIA